MVWCFSTARGTRQSNERDLIRHLTTREALPPLSNHPKRDQAPTFACAKHNAAPKREHYVATAEIKMFTEEPPIATFSKSA